MARVSTLLLASLRGNIFVYQGEELGLPQAEIPFAELQDPEAILNWPLTLGRDGARTPLPWSSARPSASEAKPWLPIVAEHRALAVDAQEGDPNSQLAYTRRVLGLRNRHASLLTGSIEFVETSDSILAFERRAAEETLLCVFNLGAKPETWRPANGIGWRIIERSSPSDGWALAPLSGLIAERVK